MSYKNNSHPQIDHSSPTFRALHPLISHMLYMIGFFNWIWGLTNVGMFLNFPYTVAMAPGFLALAVEIWYMILFQQSPAGGLHGFRGPPVVKRVVITIVAATLAGNAVGVALEKTGPVAEHKGALGVITLFAIAVPQAIAAKLRRDTKLAEKGGKQELLGPE